MKYPIGIQTFEQIRNDGFVYVDKTDMIHQLVTEGKIYFLSRPRRFGKSLLLSTIEAYFQGKKEFFTGLKIDSLETEWKQYPVIRIDLGTGNYLSVHTLETVLDARLKEWEEKYGVENDVADYSLRFEKLLRIIRSSK